VEGPTGVEITGPSYAPGIREPLAFDWNGDGRDDLLYRDGSTNWKVVQSAGDSLLPTIDSAIAHGSPTGVVIADLDVATASRTSPVAAAACWPTGCTPERYPTCYAR